MRKILFPMLAVILIGLDQWSKQLIVTSLTLGQVKPFWPGVMSLTYVQNPGAAFSIFENQQWFFILVTIIFLSVALYYFIKEIKGNLWFLIGLLLVISGGIGNFIDRLRLGYVVDMIQLDFMDFAIFNVADSYLSLGVLLLVVILWREDNGNRR